MLGWPQIICTGVIVAALGGPAWSAASVTFTPDGSGTFPRTMRWNGQARRLTVDLSGLPRNAQVFRAELVLKPAGNRTLPAAPTRVFEPGRPQRPLSFVAPRFVSLDVLGPVRSAIAQRRPLVLVAETTCNGIARLEVSHTGSAARQAPPLPVAGNLRATHRKGQTLITFDEPRLAPFPEFASGRDVSQFVNRLAQEHPGIRVRIWRSKHRITSKSVRHAKLVGECDLLTCWNRSYHQNQAMNKPPVRYRVEDNGRPLDWGTGVYAHNPTTSGKSYYAVSVAFDGQEDFSDLNQGNTLSAPIREEVGAGEPILQWIEKLQQWNWRNAPPQGRITRLIYTRWESFPHATRPNVPIDYLVSIGAPAPRTAAGSPGLAIRTDPAPVGLHLHAWGGSLNQGYGWWYNAHRGAVLIASNQMPYDWWTGHHVSYATRRTWGDGDVHPFTIDRLYGFLEWASTQWRDAPASTENIWPKLDRTRVFTAGTSMGGSGAVMHAIRLGDRVAWGLGWVGVHIPTDTSYKGSYARVYGPTDRDIKVAGTKTSPWKYFDDEWWLRNHISRDTAFVIASNGKNDNGIGWPQAVRFARALQDTRRPHQFNWGMNGHSTRTLVGQNFDIDIRLEQSLPAFTNCSLDDDIGTGTRLDSGDATGRNSGPYDGDPQGAFNAHLAWTTDDLVDQADRWELTVVLRPSAPEPSCVVDLTPRRLQQFKTRVGSKFRWVVTHLDSARKTANGRVTVDEFNLLTIPQLPLLKGRNRVVISRSGR